MREHPPKYFSVLLVVSVLCQSLTVYAHHNWAAFFDVNRDIEIEAVISAISFRNPHVRISFTVDKGTPDEKVYWTESNSVAALTRMGVTKELLTVGTRVRVAGYPSRKDDNGLFMNHMLMPDGREIVFLRTAEPRWPEAKRIGSTDIAHGRVVEQDFAKRPTSIFGVWGTIFGAKGSHRALGKETVDWTEYGQQQPQRAPHDPASCASRGILTALGSPYPVELIDSGDRIVMNAEYYDTSRVIHMMPMPEDPEVPKNDIGFSVGHWVGDTLIVETLLYRDGGTSVDDHMQVHETFHLSADHNRLAYTQTIIDPLMRAMPTMAKKWWQYVPGLTLERYDCAE